MLRDIRNLIEAKPEWGLPNFTVSPYVDPQNGQTYPMHEMTEEGFSMLVMSFTGEKMIDAKVSFLDCLDRQPDMIPHPRYEPLQNLPKPVKQGDPLPVETAPKTPSEPIKQGDPNRGAVSDDQLVSVDLTTTSRIVAERFGKQHKDVLRAIRNLECSPEFTERNFALIECIDNSGKKQTEFKISMDGFAFLAMGFTGREAASWKERFIAAFNAMREYRSQPAAAPANFDPHDPTQMLAFLADCTARANSAKAQIQDMKPKVTALEYMEGVVAEPTVNP